MLFNQYRWGTLNNPASALYSVTYHNASRAAGPLLQGPSCRESPRALFRSSWVKYNYNRPSDRKKMFGRLQSYLTQLDRKGYDVISCNWAPGEVGNSPGKVLENALTQSEARNVFCSTFSWPTLSCEPTERYISIGLHI